MRYSTLGTMFLFGTRIRYPQASGTLWANVFLPFSKGARLIAFHHCIYETFRIINMHLRLPFGHSHPVIGALEQRSATLLPLCTLESIALAKVPSDGTRNGIQLGE